MMLMVITSTSCINARRCAKYYPPQITKTDTLTVTTTEHVRDTIFKIEADSSWIKALIECDSNGKATIRELLDYRNGNRSQLPRLNLVNNILTADCKCDSNKIHALLKDREKITDHRTSETITPPAIEVKFIPGWMWFFGITGMLSWGVVVVALVFSLVKSKFKLWL